MTTEATEAQEEHRERTELTFPKENKKGSVKCLCDPLCLRGFVRDYASARAIVRLICGVRRLNGIAAPSRIATTMKKNLLCGMVSQ